MRLVSVGPVTRAAGLYTEPMWEASFKHNNGSSISVHLAAPLLTFLPLGSLWKSQSLHKLHGGYQLEQVKVEANRQSIIWRANENSLEFMGKNTSGTIPYIFLPSPEDPRDGVLVRCSEVIRFYFGASGLLTRFIFDFAKEASQNDALFFSDLTGFVPDGHFVIAPSRHLKSDKEAHFIAKQLAYKPSRKSLALIASSARSLNSEKGNVWPVATAPIEGTTVWNVTGERKNVVIYEAGLSPQTVSVFGVASIFKCSAPIEYPEIRILRPPTKKRPPTIKDPMLVPVAKSISNTPTVKSSEAGKVPLDLEVRPMLDISETRPGMVDNPPKLVRSIEDNESGKTIRLAPVFDDVDEVSALLGNGNDESAGSLVVVPGGEDPNEEWEKTTKEELEPIDRSSLPSLFEPFDLDLLKINDAPQTQIPPEFLPLIEAARLIANEAENKWAINIADKPVKNLLEGKAYLYDLPETWGSRIHCSKSPTGHRRALVIRFEAADIEVALLDIEQRHKSEFSAYIILTRRPDSLTSDLLAKVIHWRLYEKGTNKCWPTRETHSGFFWASRLQHSYLSEPHKRIRNKIFSYLEDFTNAANKDSGIGS